jgi:hypothetical protein
MAKYQSPRRGDRGAALTCGGFAFALVLTGAAHAVTLTCQPAENSTGKPDAATLCAETLAYAKQNLAVADSTQTSQGSIDVTVLRANDRGAALAGIWRDGQGKTLAETSLSAAFFDTSSSPALRENLIKALFQQLAPQLILTAP